MKILQIIYESLHSPFGYGGAGIRAYEIYKRLVDRHDITLLCMKYPDAKEGFIEGLRHLFVGTESKSLIKSVLAYTIETSRFVHKHGNEFDIIIENFLPSMPFFSCFITKRPVILQVQGILERHSIKKFNPLFSIPMSIVESFYPNLYSNFIFVSEVTKEKVINRKGYRFKTCKVIPNGIQSEYLNFTPIERDYILFFSRIDTYTKGLDVLIKAFIKVNKEFPNIRLVLAGYEFNNFNDLVSGLPKGVREKVEYVGFASGQEKIRLISESILFVLPSRHESFPVSIIEACACQKPVIVSDIEELAFVKKVGFGLDFPSGSEDGLSSAIISLLNDHSMREKMGKIGRSFAQGFLWDNLAIEFEEALKEVL